jgi:hypothetical protein
MIGGAIAIPLVDSKKRSIIKDSVISYVLEPTHLYIEGVVEIGIWYHVSDADTTQGEVIIGKG